MKEGCGGAEEAITIENSFIKLRFGQSGLMEVCFEIHTRFIILF